MIKVLSNHRREITKCQNLAKGNKFDEKLVFRRVIRSIKPIITQELEVHSFYVFWQT